LDIANGVFPESEEILICRLGFDGGASQGIGTGKTKMGTSADRVNPNAAMVDTFALDHSMYPSFGKLMHCRQN
jgi:hypothetical protein